MALTQSSAGSGHVWPNSFELIGHHHGIPTPEPAAMETGRTLRPTPMYAKLYCLTFERTTSELFGDLETDVQPGATRAARSHKFIPVFIGAEVASALATAGGQWSPIDDQWTQCRRRVIEHPGGSCQLYLWPFSVALFHLIEDLAIESVAHLAVWRRITYEQNIQWAQDQLKALTASDVAGTALRAQSLMGERTRLAKKRPPHDTTAHVHPSRAGTASR